MSPLPPCNAGHKPRQRQSGANINTSFLRIVAMTVLLVNRKTEAEKLITIPATDSFSQFVAYVRAIEPNRNWEVFESF
jgi:hypothetical protein